MHRNIAVLMDCDSPEELQTDMVCSICNGALECVEVRPLEYKCTNCGIRFVADAIEYLKKYPAPIN